MTQSITLLDGGLGPLILESPRNAPSSLVAKGRRKNRRWFRIFTTISAVQEPE